MPVKERLFLLAVATIESLSQCCRTCWGLVLSPKIEEVVYLLLDDIKTTGENQGQQRALQASSEERSATHNVGEVTTKSMLCTCSVL